jgi:hypothetical protein
MGKIICTVKHEGVELDWPGSLLPNNTLYSTGANNVSNPTLAQRAQALYERNPVTPVEVEVEFNLIVDVLGTQESDALLQSLADFVRREAAAIGDCKTFNFGAKSQTGISVITIRKPSAGKTVWTCTQRT